MTTWKNGDPALKSQAYRGARARLRARRDPCARCGGMIDYDGPRYFTINGKRIENPLAFDAGHRVDRVHGGNEAFSNLQAEHVRCSRRAGARLGARRRWGMPRAAVTANRW
jgi:hypothetical protein